MGIAHADEPQEEIMMATRVRITIEYDLDLEPDTIATPEILAQELHHWVTGQVEVADVVACEGSDALTIAIVP